MAYSVQSSEEDVDGDKELFPIQKVAILMVALGQETSAEVMKYLNEYEIE